MKAETAKALNEMMTVAARDLLGYEGPVTVEILRDPSPAWCDMFDTDANPAPPQEEFFYAQSFA